MELEMGRNAAEVQQGVRRGVGAKAELDDDIETPVTRDLQAMAPYYPKAQRLWWRSLRKTSMKAIYERYLVHMALSASLTYP